MAPSGVRAHRGPPERSVVRARRGPRRGSPARPLRSVRGAAHGARQRPGSGCDARGPSEPLGRAAGGLHGPEAPGLAAGGLHEPEAMECARLGPWSARRCPRDARHHRGTATQPVECAPASRFACEARSAPAQSWAESGRETQRRGARLRQGAPARPRAESANRGPELGPGTARKVRRAVRTPTSRSTYSARGARPGPTAREARPMRATRPAVRQRRGPLGLGWSPRISVERARLRPWCAPASRVACSPLLVVHGPASRLACLACGARTSVEMRPEAREARPLVRVRVEARLPLSLRSPRAQQGPQLGPGGVRARVAARGSVRQQLPWRLGPRGARGEASVVCGPWCARGEALGVWCGRCGPRVCATIEARLLDSVGARQRRGRLLGPKRTRPGGPQRGLKPISAGPIPGALLLWRAVVRTPYRARASLSFFSRSN